MAARELSTLLQQLRGSCIKQETADASDDALLSSYLGKRDEAAFEALVRRHGPMVLSVCRRILHQTQDAEDAFQATFLVLARKAASIQPTSNVGPWLYGVALRTAQEARKAAAKRRAKEAAVLPRTPPPNDGYTDLRIVIDEELAKLSEKHRVVIILCHLEGKSLEEAAQSLGCPQGTVKSRLARARTMLGQRLSRRGVTIAGGTLAAVLSQNTGSAIVPTALISSTTRAAMLFASGNGACTGGASLAVVALANEVTRTNGFLKVLAPFLALAVIGVGVELAHWNIKDDGKTTANDLSLTAPTKDPQEARQNAFGGGETREVYTIKPYLLSTVLPGFSEDSTPRTVGSRSFPPFLPELSPGEPLLDTRWVFDDEVRGLKKAPLFKGAPEVISIAMKRAAIREPEKGFLVRFSKAPFPGADIVLEGGRHEDGGTVFRWEEIGQDIWLGQPLLRYLNPAPKRIFLKVEPLPSDGNGSAR